MTPLLKELLASWLKERGRGKTLFCKSNGKPIAPREAHHYFRRALRLCPWKGLKGWHVFRHSFISALASRGVDQRIIDDIVGHQTEQQRRREAGGDAGRVCGKAIGVKRSPVNVTNALIRKRNAMLQFGFRDGSDTISLPQTSISRQIGVD